VPDPKEVTRVQELIYEMKVEDIMVTDVVSIDVNTRMSDLRELLREKRISGVPVVDGDNLAGMVSIEDFITYLADGGEACSVASRMSTSVKTLYNNDPLVHAVREFDLLGYGRFPVLDRNTGKLVGIITKGDIVNGLLNKMEIDYLKVESLKFRSAPKFKDLITNKTTFILQYSIHGDDIDHAGETSSRLKKALKRMHIPPDILRRVAIAAYEAEMNTVLYANGGSLMARVTPKKITIDVEDSGPGIENIEKAMKPGFSTAADWIRELGFGAGMGLPNIKKCSDSMDLESVVGEGTHLKFEVHLPD